MAPITDPLPTMYAAVEALTKDPAIEEIEMVWWDEAPGGFERRLTIAVRRKVQVISFNQGDV